MSRLTAWLDGGPLLSDGAWGTEFQKAGLALGDFADAWNLHQPERVRAVAQSYVDAGSDAILTNTFRSNPITLGPHGLAADMEAINAAGVRISREAAARTGARVIGSMGPSGKLLIAGEITEDDIDRAFEAQARALASAGPDALLLETFSDIGEATIALRAALRTGLPVIVSFVFDAGKNKDRTMTGATPEQVASAMTEAGADALGANCGAGIAAFPNVCSRLRTATALPLWIKANAGLPELVEGSVRYASSASEFIQFLPALFAAGASFVGGCCGTDPDFVRAMREELDRIPASGRS